MAEAASLAPYLPRLTLEWLTSDPQATWRSVEATLVFADVSGFTKLSERLARRGPVGAEELTDALNSCFARILDVAYREGGSLLKFGGDALLIAFTGHQHPTRACHAALAMRDTLRRLGPVETSAGSVRLRMSVGVHSDAFHLFRVGGSHRELLVTGPPATTTVEMEAAADAGEILVSPATAAAIPRRLLGEAKGPGRLLRGRPPEHDDGPAFPAVPETAGDLSEAVPTALRRHLLSGGVEPEHRHVSVAFVHFDGMDALVRDSGPATGAMALDELVRAVQEAVEDQEITFLATDIDRDGGKIILVAGAPSTLDDDDGRLLRAVSRIVRGRHDLAVRAGVHRGRVFAGEVGPSYRRTYTVMGDAVNLAARLMAAALPGQVIATAGVLERSRTAFATEALPPFMVKGKARPVSAHALGPPVGTRSDADRPVLPLVGRDKEMAVVAEALASARRGTGRAVAVVGGPGMGKSRLVEEARRLAAGMVVLRVTCEAYESSTPYLPFRRLLRDVLGLPVQDDGEVALRALRALVSDRAPELLAWLPLLGPPLNLNVPPTPETADLEPRFRPQRTNEVVYQLLSRVIPHPALFVFEDVHAMDEASAALLARLVAGVAGVPWALCLTGQHGASGFPCDDESVCRVDLGPLDEADALGLVSAATAEAPLRPHEARAIVGRAGGNPLFLAELVRTVIAHSGSLPESIEALLGAQIDRLEPPDRRALRYAAVLGVSFERDLLAEVLGEDGYASTSGPLQDFLEARDDGRFQFRSRLVRDVAYEGLAFRRRRELHGHAGEAIERMAGAAMGDRAELLSLHFLHAQRYDKAWRHAREAADRARQNYANVDAAELYERALTAARWCEGLEAAEVAGVWEALGDVRETAGMYEAATAAYRAARRLLDDDVVRNARLCLKEARLAERQGRYPAGVRWARRGLRLVDGLEGPEAGSQRAELTVWYAAVRQRQGRHAEAIGWCRRAVEEATASGDKRALAQAYRILDWAHASLGRGDLATHSVEALAIYEELGDLSGQAAVLNNLGGFAYYQGRWDEALELYARGRDAQERAGNAVDAAVGTCNIGEILAAQGRLDEAEERFREALRVWKAAGFRYATALATMHLGRVTARKGRYSEGLGLLEEARRCFEETDAHADVLETDVWIAEYWLLRRQPARALSVASDALGREAVLGGAGVQRATLHRIRGYAFAQRGDTVEAWAALDESLSAGRQAGAAYEVALTLEALALVAALRGESYEPSPAEHRLALERLGVRSLTEIPVSGTPDREWVAGQ